MSEFDALHARGYHLGSAEVASLTSDQYKELLHSAAMYQRGGPEGAMLHFQNLVGGSPLSHSLEHVGDLTHRTAEKGGAFGTEFVKPKVESQLHHLLHPYGWDRESHESISANRQFRSSRGEAFPTDDEIHGLLQVYTDAHRQVPVYNRPMQAGRDAAIAVGQRDSRGAAGHLMSLKSMFPDWSQRMGQQDAVSFLNAHGR